VAATKNSYSSCIFTSFPVSTCFPLHINPTGNTSAYIWASWGYLESVTGNVSRARKLFDAAIVVDETHAAAWHKWGMLEMQQGNYLRAR